MIADSASPPSLRQHLPEIDGLRGVAVALVFFNHSIQLFPGGPATGGTVWNPANGAWLGVDLFFLVSGYLITTILLASRSQERPFRVFWFRRALRIFPLAYFYLAVLVTLGLVRSSFHELAHSSLPLWIGAYVVNFHIAAHGWSLPEVSHLWSLAIEEQFYLLWPLLVLWLPVRRLPLVLISIIALSPLLRWYVSGASGSNAVYVLTYTRLDGLAMGALIATALQGPWRDKLFQTSRKLVVPSLLVIAVVLGIPLGVTAVHPLLFDIFGYSFVCMAFAVWTLRALDPTSRARRYLRVNPLRRIGTLCYGLYIWHPLVARFVRQGAVWSTVAVPRGVLGLLWLALTFLVANASYRWLEVPFLRLKSRFPIVQAAGAVTPVG
jgi:peptidoglycan/LPS O-acetylase OafA/YrhL